MATKHLLKKLTYLFLLTLSTSLSYAQQHNHHTEHGHGQHTMTMSEPSQKLLAIEEMPKGQALQPLSKIPNQSNQQGVFQTQLMIMPKTVTIVPNKPTTLWLYNQTILPLIEVNSGDTVKVTMQNHLPADTTVHWHGLPVTPQVDGNPQHPIKPGDTVTIEFTIPKDFAGTYWFHPHPHETTAEQVYKGLAGAFIVRDPNDPLKELPEQQLFFSDLKLAENGQIAENSMLDWMNGREGQFQLINGQYQPVISLDGTQRWRIWNGNSARYLKLSFPAEQVEAYQVASDGGLLEVPQPITTLLLSPAERAEIVLTPKKQGEFILTALAYDRGKMGDVAKEQDLPLAQVKMQLPNKKFTLPKQLATIPELAKATASYQVEFTEVNNPNSPAGVDFLVNGKKHDLNRVDVTVNAGETQEWEIFNNSHMDHSFHLHGPQFQVKEYELANNISQPTFKQLKDTINLRPYEKARIVFTDYDKGSRMYHCHIIEHEALGMMGQAEVK